ncbi:MAG: response regulator [Cyanobacteria bacterium P01_A01_bin.135]
MQSLKQKLSHDVKYRASIIPVLLESCHRLNIFSPQQLRQALHLSLLRELDNVLFGSSGQASFLQQPELADQLPINGFELSSLVEEVRRRRMIWHQIKKIIPTPDTHLALNNEEIERVSLPSEHRERLVSLLKCGQTPSAISQTLCQDELAITKRLAQLVHQGLIVPQVANKGNRAAIVIVDDSQLMLQMFQALVSGWGYDVYSHTDPQSALQIMLNAAPAAIFLDVNMPEISGFDLLKQIRRQPSLREIPLIMLTAERTLSNNWRAQWSGCQFLSKPLSPDEVPQFRLDLRMLLEAVTQ